MSNSTNDKLLSIEQAETLAKDIKEKSPTQGLFIAVLRQLADTMRDLEKMNKLADEYEEDKNNFEESLEKSIQENERLRDLLKRVTEDTEYSCMPADLQQAIESELSNKDSDNGN